MLRKCRKICEHFRTPARCLELQLEHLELTSCSVLCDFVLLFCSGHSPSSIMTVTTGSNVKVEPWGLFPGRLPADFKMLLKYRMCCDVPGSLLNGCSSRGSSDLHSWVRIIILSINTLIDQPGRITVVSVCVQETNYLSYRSKLDLKYFLQRGRAEVSAGKIKAPLLNDPGAPGGSLLP